MISNTKYVITTLLTIFLISNGLNAQIKAINIESSYIADPPVTTNSHASTLVEHKPNEILPLGLEENMKEQKMLEFIFRIIKIKNGQRQKN